MAEETVNNPTLTARQVAEQNPELVSELRQEMNAWLEKNEDSWLGVTGIPVSAHLV